MIMVNYNYRTFIDQRKQKYVFLLLFEFILSQKLHKSIKYKLKHSN